MQVPQDNQPTPMFYASKAVQHGRVTQLLVIGHYPYKIPKH